MNDDKKHEITARMRRLLDAAYVEEDDEAPASPRPRTETGDRIFRFLELVESGMLGRNYQRPHNALDELYRRAPVYLWPLMLAVEEEDSDTTKPKPTWPDVPYHYGMGRIKAYEELLSHLSEKDREKEIAACRGRYEGYYQAGAGFLVEKMRGRGFDLTGINREEHGNDRDLQNAANSALEQLQAQRPRNRNDNWDRPVLDLGRGRSRRR